MGRAVLLITGICTLCCAVAPAWGAIKVRQVEDINPSGSSQPEELFALGDQLLFKADDGTTGVELWRADGDGAQQIADMNPSGSSNPTDFAKLGGEALFGAFATSEPGSELYKTDGSGPPELVANINTNPNVGSNPHYMTTLGNSVFFDAVTPGVGHSLHRSNGSGAVMLEDSEGNPVNESNPEPEFTKLGNSLIFRAYTVTSGNELWITDGTSGGTKMLKDIRDSGDGAPYGFVALGKELFFSATTADEGTELWKTDGTPSGTRLVKDIREGPSSSSPFFGYGFAKVGKNLYFNAITDGSGSELWKTNGSSGGTKLVKDIYPGNSGSSPSAITRLGKKAVFGASDNVRGAQIFVSDGTKKGTKSLKQVSVQGDFDRKLHQLGDTVFFSGNGELWGTDGTKKGTKLVKDINPSTTSDPSLFTKVGKTLFFSANGPEGRELYKVTGG